MGFSYNKKIGPSPYLIICVTQDRKKERKMNLPSKETCVVV